MPIENRRELLYTKALYGSKGHNYNYNIKNNNNMTHTNLTSTPDNSKDNTNNNNQNHTSAAYNDREEFLVERHTKTSAAITSECRLEREVCDRQRAAPYYENFSIADLSVYDLSLSKQLVLQKYFPSTEQNYALYENLCRGCGYGVFEATGNFCNFCECIVKGGVGNSVTKQKAEEENIYENVSYNCSDFCKEDLHQCSLCSNTEQRNKTSEESLLERSSFAISVKRSKSLNKRNATSAGKRSLFQGFLFGTLKRVKKSSVKATSPSKPQIVHNVDGFENVFRTQETFDLQRICELKRSQTSCSDQHIYGRLRRQSQNDSGNTDHTPASTLSKNSLLTNESAGKLSQSYHQLLDTESTHTSCNKLNASEEQLVRRRPRSIFHIRFRSKKQSKPFHHQIKVNAPPPNGVKQSLYLPDSVCSWMTSLRHETHPYRSVGLTIDDDEILFCNNKSVPPARNYFIYTTTSLLAASLSGWDGASLKTLTNNENIGKLFAEEQSSLIQLPERLGNRVGLDDSEHSDCEYNSVTLRHCQVVQQSKASPVGHMIEEFKRNLRAKRIHEQQESANMREATNEGRAKRQAIYLKNDDRNLQLPSRVTNGNNNNNKTASIVNLNINFENKTIANYTVDVVTPPNTDEFNCSHKQSQIEGTLKAANNNSNSNTDNNTQNQQQAAERHTLPSSLFSRCLDRQGITSSTSSVKRYGITESFSIAGSVLATHVTQYCSLQVEVPQKINPTLSKAVPLNIYCVEECNAKLVLLDDCVNTNSTHNKLSIQEILSDLALSVGVNRVVISYCSERTLWIFLHSINGLCEYQTKYLNWSYDRLVRKFHKFRIYCALKAIEAASEPDVVAIDESTAVGVQLDSELHNISELDQLDGSADNYRRMAIENDDCADNGEKSHYACPRSEVLEKEPKVVLKSFESPKVPLRDPCTALATGMGTPVAICGGAVLRRPHPRLSENAHEHRKMTVPTANSIVYKDPTEHDIYQPIWKFQTRGEAEERYQTDADYFVVSRAMATEQEIVNSADESASDEGEWETDDDFQFTTQLDERKRSNEILQTATEMTECLSETLLPPLPPIPFDACSLNSLTVPSHSRRSSFGSTVTGFGSSTATLASSVVFASSLVHPILRSIGIFYSLTDTKMRAVVYDYDRINASMYFAKWPTIREDENQKNNDSEIERTPIAPDRSPIPPLRTTSVSKTPSPQMERSESDSKWKVLRPAPPPPAQSAVKASMEIPGKIHILPDSVMAWKFLLLDVHYLEDEEDMMVSSVAFIESQKVKDNELKPMTVLNRIKSKSTQHLTEEKTSITSFMRSKFQRGVLKLGGGSPKCEKKSLGIFRRTDCNSLYQEDGLKPQYQIFGAPLHALEMYKSLQVPRFVVDAVQLIEHKDCIRQDGLYRASGNKLYIDELKHKLTVSYIYDPKLLRTNDDIHTLTSLLKQFFRELPEPLIPEEVYQQLGANLAECVDDIRQAFEEIPEPNLSTLRFIVKHLTNVAACCADNRMPASNLAIVWGPCLLSANRIEFNIGRMNTLAKVLIENYERIFRSNERLVS